ncbi:hypothetical protein BU15DRAFT_74170 [Melanogaster broomeanus]|nr:hypothetical protein BU15DRAFT_74170 [Melanogaster broomeanus]
MQKRLLQTGVQILRFLYHLSVLPDSATVVLRRKTSVQTTTKKKIAYPRRSLSRDAGTATGPFVTVAYYLIPNGVGAAHTSFARAARKTAWGLVITVYGLYVRFATQEAREQFFAPRDFVSEHLLPPALGDRVVHYETNALLDPSLYALSTAEAAFFKAATGIDDDAALKAHIIMAQAKAYKVAPYPCIYGFSFLRMVITRNMIYEDILKIGRERKDAIFLDIGCCFSVDSRKVAADGFPACNIVASDLKQEFLELSHVLFNTSQDTYPGHFVAGDIFDPVVLSVEPSSRGVPPSPRPDCLR